ncbi:hypothetical protein Tco_1410679 [Tanacetum coccineum]
MGKLLKEVLMIDELSIVETDKVNHTVEMDMLKLVVEVECFGLGTLPSNTHYEPVSRFERNYLRSKRCAYHRPRFYYFLLSSKVVEREPEVTKDTVLPTNNGSTRRQLRLSKFNLKYQILSPLLLPLVLRCLT